MITNVSIKEYVPLVSLYEITTSMGQYFLGKAEQWMEGHCLLVIRSL